MMDAAELLAIFEKEYNRTDWLHALREIFQIRNLHEVPQEVDLPANDFDARAMEMGFFETSEGLLIGIFEVSITPNILLERNKVGLRNMMRKVYQRDMDAALIVFSQGSSWRFSYASELTVDNKETGKREKRQTDPKRYTYLLGTGQHCRTAAERFAKLKSTTDLFDTKVSISEIEKAFSVDILTKDFYRELSNWYFWALNHVTFPDDDEPNEEARNPSNLIRLITRLIFVWFLKQKGLVPDSLFDKEKIWPHLNFGYDAESNYYKAILQNLFFATLNQEMNKRSFRRNGQHYNITNLYRYRKLFKNPDETIGLFKNIPFLNGGLFECLDKPHPTEKTPQGNEKIVRIDGFSDRDNNPLQVPDYLFFGGADAVDLSQVYDDNRQKNVHVRGIIEILNSYNFTVEENTPLEIQVALDPELLGKVFENLLASYNPETKTTARKQTGSFYTPREIVNYMVDESLIAYLKQKLAANSMNSEEETEPKLRELVSYSGNGNPFDETETQSIVKAIDHIKVLDPACGSGAFPMGILQQLVHVLQKLDPDNKLWKQLQMQRAQEEIQEAIAAGDTANFAERLKEIADAFENNAEDYGRKLYLIENCIYGVDIQPIAVQIAKLRFFISLLVDQTINAKADNLGIRALPNLETKFVSANALVGLQTKMTLKPDKVYQLEAELENVRRRHFRAITPETKRKWRYRDSELRKEIGNELMNTGFPETDANQISNWDPYNQNIYAVYFDKYWMFGVEDGFDIILGNPPYIGHKGGIKTIFRELKNTYLGKKFNNERMDIFYYFFHVAIDLSNSKGIINFITTNYYLTADSAIKLRKDIKERAKIYKLVNFNELKVFESAMGQHNILTFLTKNRDLPVCEVININREGIADYELLQSILNKNDRETIYYTIDPNKIFDGINNYIRLHYGDAISLKAYDRVLNKIKGFNKILGDYFSISQGIVTGIDKVSPKHVRRLPQFEGCLGEGVFVLSEDEKEIVGESRLLKPWFKNSDITRYYVNENPTKWLIHTSVNIKLLQHSNIADHLIKYRELIIERNFESGELSKAKNLNCWWALSSSRWDYDFEKPKIVSPQRSYTNTFAYTEKSWYASADVYFIANKSDHIDLKFLLGILNSKLIYFWLYNRGKRKGEMLELYLTPLSEIPIILPSSITQNRIKVIVDEIIRNKTLNPSHDSKLLENQIDELVYKLYNLTYAEVKIIDPDFWLGEEEYKSIKLEE